MTEAEMGAMQIPGQDSRVCGRHHKQGAAEGPRGREPGLPTLTSDRERIVPFCCLDQHICGDLLWQPQKIHTPVSHHHEV